MKKLICALAVGVLMTSAAQAHHVWLEPRDGKMTLQFGEFGENLRETTPGLLDKFGKPAATLLGADGERQLTLDKTAGGFVMPAIPAGRASVVAVDADYPVFASTKDGKTTRTIWTPAARYVSDFSQHQPRLALDIVPAGKPGTFKVYYNLQPLPKAKISAVVQSGWAKEATSDDNGEVSFDLPWRGAYVLEAHHVDKTPGTRNGVAYDVASYVTSLSFQKPDGVDAVPAVPASREK